MRYVRLYFTCIKRSMLSRLEYKKDTIIALLSFLFSNACSLCSIFFILQAIPSLQGYSIVEVGFFYGFSMLPIALAELAKAPASTKIQIISIICSVAAPRL